MGARGQPPLAFYLRAMGHAAAALPRPHTRAVVVTAPDQAGPLLLTTYCLLLTTAPDQAPYTSTCLKRRRTQCLRGCSPCFSNKSCIPLPCCTSLPSYILLPGESHSASAQAAGCMAAAWPASAASQTPRVPPLALPLNLNLIFALTLTPNFTPTLTLNPTRPALPLALSSSHSFAADLSLMLCAQSLVLASSSLSGEGGLLRDSPHLRDVYRFEPSEEGCLPAAPHRRMVRPLSWQCHSSLPWPAGAESPGSWLRYALGTSRSASQGPKGGCGAAVRPGQKSPTLRRSDQPGRGRVRPRSRAAGGGCASGACTPTAAVAATVSTSTRRHGNGSTVRRSSSRCCSTRR